MRVQLYSISQSLMPSLLTLASSRFKSLTCRMSGPMGIPTLLALTTSLRWPPSSACTSSCIFHRKGIRATYPNYLPPPQRYLLDDNLTMSQGSTAPLPSSGSYTQNSGCYNS